MVSPLPIQKMAYTSYGSSESFEAGKSRGRGPSPPDSFENRLRELERSIFESPYWKAQRDFEIATGRVAALPSRTNDAEALRMYLEDKHLLPPEEALELYLGQGGCLSQEQRASALDKLVDSYRQKTFCESHDASSSARAYSIEPLDRYFSHQQESVSKVLQLYKLFDFLGLGELAKETLELLFDLLEHQVGELQLRAQLLAQALVSEDLELAQRAAFFLSNGSPFFSFTPVDRYLDRYPGIEAPQFPTLHSPEIFFEVLQELSTIESLPADLHPLLCFLRTLQREREVLEKRLEEPGRENVKLFFEHYQAYLFNELKQRFETDENRSLSCRAIALCYRHGLGTLPSIEAAIQWLVQASKEGEVEAMIDLAELYRRRADEGDNERAFLLHQEAAKRGHPPAQRELGKDYLYGWGTDRDPLKGKEHLEEASRERDPEALVTLAEAHDQEIVLLSSDGKLSQDIFPRNMSQSQAYLKEAFALLEEEVRRGDPNVQFLLGRALKLMQGLPGSDLGTYYKRVAAQEHAYERAAAQGHAKAQTALTECVSRMDSAEMDLKQKRQELYERAAEQGEPQALYALGSLKEYDLLLKRLTVGEIDWGNRKSPEAIVLFKESAKRGCWLAERELCRHYLTQGDFSKMLIHGRRVCSKDPCRENFLLLGAALLDWEAPDKEQRKKNLQEALFFLERADAFPYPIDIDYYGGGGQDFDRTTERKLNAARKALEDLENQ